MAKKVLSKPFAPESGGVDLRDDLPRIPPSLPFMLIYAAESWHVIDGQLLPHLISLPVEQGVNQVKKRSNGTWDFVALEVELARSSRKRIPWDLHPSGSYMAAVETNYGNRVCESYISVFSSVYPGDSHVYPDVEAYAKWVASLVTSGKLPECPVHLIRTMLETARTRLVGVEVSHRKSPSAATATQMEHLNDEVEVLQVALESRTDKPRAKVKAKPSKLKTDGDE